MAILEPVHGRFGNVSVAFGQLVFTGSIEIRKRFYRKALCKDFFTKITLRKNVHADFYGLSDIDSVVTDFDPNMERDKIGAAPYDGSLRTLVEGITPFVVRFGVKVLMTSFPARPLWSSLYVEVIRRVAADDILYGWISEDARILAKRQILGSRIRVFDTMPRDVRDQCAGFRARPRSNHGFRGCDDYFDLHFPYRFRHDSIPFKVCDMFSAYVTCMVGIKHLFEDNF
ncbi:hypothetical protein DY000_02008006 [Brassica cretica]|uniref:Uncharacterized protein n=1 Tax=Brassica cretica TaxID=69181 RepID=A0ABQ7BXC1_BRACR|nr:hypothetical protein DY000_02008006 [Brassica cretica]